MRERSEASEKLLGSAPAPSQRDGWASAQGDLARSPKSSAGSSISTEDESGSDLPAFDWQPDEELARRIVLLLQKKDVNELNQVLAEEWQGGANVCHQDCSRPLHWATRMGYLTVAQVLLEKAVPAKDTGKPLNWVSKHVVGRLPSKSMVNARDEHHRTALHIASSKAHTEVARLLLQYGASVVATQKGGWTPLHLAVDNGDTEMTELLITSGADVMAKTKVGSTPLHLASTPEVAQLLILHGADMHAKAENGHTPLHAPATEMLAEVLLRHGADVHAKTNTGDTALHCAAYMGRASVVKLLLKQGADLHAKNQVGWTPLEAAKTQEIRRLLQVALWS